MTDSVKILGALILGAVWLMSIRDPGPTRWERCMQMVMEKHGDDYWTAKRNCAEAK